MCANYLDLGAFDNIGNAREKYTGNISIVCDREQIRLILLVSRGCNKPAIVG